MAAKVSKKRVGEIMQAALTSLKEAGGQARARDIIKSVENKLTLTDYEKEPYEKSGWVRWRAIMHFYSIGCVKAGYIEKSGGKWNLTEAGDKALGLDPEAFIKESSEKYKEWKKVQDSEAEDEDTESESGMVRQATYEQALEESRSEIQARIDELDPYEFQNLVGHLLSGMGFKIRRISPKGPDGGVDIMAYSDPIGAKAPRVWVQVKHRQAKVTESEIRDFHSIIRAEGDTGLIVSSGGFAHQALREAERSLKHIDTMDLDRLITLWDQHYETIPQAGKQMLPIVRVAYLAPVQE